MNSYFEVGVRYDKTMEDGVVRKVTENYLLDALSFTEAEKRAAEEMEAYISGEFRVVTEKITNIVEVVTTNDTSADKSYKVKHSLITIDEKTAKEKKQAPKPAARKARKAEEPAADEAAAPAPEAE